jgi:hypothetical protein
MHRFILATSFIRCLDARREVMQPPANVLIDHIEALGLPALTVLEILDEPNRRSSARNEDSEHPHHYTRPRVGALRQQA